MTDNFELLKDALQEVMSDEGFKLESPLAAESLKAATALLEWSEESAANKARASSFTKTLLQHLHHIFTDGLNREVMWRNFHTFRTSKDHFLLWGKFLKDSVNQGGPILIQFVTNYMFKQLVKRKFPAAFSVCQDTIETCLSYQEENSLRYAAGYIPRNLIKKIKRSSLDNKEVLQLCLLDLIEEDGMGDDESQEWIQAVNRGGLNNVTQSMFEFMRAMELVVKGFLKKEDKPRNIKSELMSMITANEDVRSQWEEVSAEWEPEESRILFARITDLWVTMRGFSYASAWMEQWKESTKKSVQKSQPLRKKLNKN